MSALAQQHCATMRSCVGPATPMGLALPQPGMAYSRCNASSTCPRLLSTPVTAVMGRRTCQPGAPRRHAMVAAPPAAAAAAAATTAGAATFPALQALLEPMLPYAMAAAAACCFALIALMAFAPGAQITQRSARSSAPLTMIGLLYGIVLLASWATDTLHLMMPGSLQAGLSGGWNPQFFPTLGSVQALFGRPFTAASFLLHVAAINLIAARSTYLDGLANRLPTTHSVLLGGVVGPLGLLCHQLTKALYGLASTVAGRDLRPAAQPVAERIGDGTITLMPYDK